MDVGINHSEAPAPILTFLGYFEPGNYTFLMTGLPDDLSAYDNAEWNYRSNDKYRYLFMSCCTETVYRELYYSITAAPGYL